MEHVHLPFLLFGSVSVLFAIGHEIMWLRRWNYSRVMGVIVENVESKSDEDSKYYVQRIEYELDGRKKQFLSQYPSSRPRKVGTAVTLVASSNSDDAEVCGNWRRLFTPLILLLFGAIFIGLGIKIW